MESRIRIPWNNSVHFIIELHYESPFVNVSFPESGSKWYNSIFGLYHDCEEGSCIGCKPGDFIDKFSNYVVDFLQCRKCEQANAFSDGLHGCQKCSFDQYKFNDSMCGHCLIGKFVSKNQLGCQSCEIDQVSVKGITYSKCAENQISRDGQTCSDGYELWKGSFSFKYFNYSVYIFGLETKVLKKGNAFAISLKFNDSVRIASAFSDAMKFEQRTTDNLNDTYFILSNIRKY
jgi:hypothetical protein